jgi:NitT/TauT family transport system ATP-binding protein
MRPMSLVLEETAELSVPRVCAWAVGKIYRSARGDVVALDGIDLEICNGEFLSIVGPSGCGKSTLLRCVAGLGPISSGEIRIDGRLVQGPVENTGIVFQRDVLLDWRTALSNVLLAVEFRGGRRREWVGRAQELLAKVGLGAFTDRYPWELSGGMRQRVAICRALLSDPPILLMDEPFGALDALTRDEINAELQRIWIENRKTVLFITHSISEAVFLSDRVAVMSPKPGRILEFVSVDLPRPRKLAIRDTAEFCAKSSRIREVLSRSGGVRE